MLMKIDPIKLLCLVSLICSVGPFAAQADVTVLSDDFNGTAPGNWTVRDPSNNPAGVVFGHHVGTYDGETRDFEAAHESPSVYLSAANRILGQQLVHQVQDDWILRFKMLPSTWARGEWVGVFNQSGTKGYVVFWDSSSPGAWNGEGKITIKKYSGTSEVQWGSPLTNLTDSVASGHSLTQSYADAVAGNAVDFAEVVLTWQAATGTLELFVNGELKGYAVDTEIGSFGSMYIRSNERLLLDDLVLYWLQGSANPSVTAYSLPDLPSESFAVSANGQYLPVRSYKDFDYVHFEFNGTTNISVTAKFMGSLNAGSCRVRPLSRGISSSVLGNELRFSINSPQQLVVNIHNERKLFIFADPPETNVPQLGDNGVYNILDYSVDRSGHLVNTTAIQGAINGLPGGATLYFPAGVYRTGSLQLKSDMTLYLAPGALLKGSDDYHDIGFLPTSPTFLYFLAAQAPYNLTIRGRGAVDGNGHVVRTAWDADQGHKVPGRLLSIREGLQTEVEGIFLRDSYSWNTHIVDCNTFDMSFTKILNDFRHSNGDGLDVDGCNYVTVEDSFIYAEDDAISPKASWSQNSPSAYTFRDCVLWSNCATGIRLGTETNADSFSGMTFENIDILRASTMVRIFNYDGADISDINFFNLNVEEYVYHLTTSVDEFPPRRSVSQGESFLVYIYQPQEAGTVTDILFENVTALGYHEGSRFSAPLNLNDDPINDIDFIHFVADGTVQLNYTDAKFTVITGAADVTLQ
jgi:hypothetical protein